MKFEWNKRYTTIAVYAGLTVAAAIVITFIFLRWDTVGTIASLVFHVCKPLIYAIGVAYLLWPVLAFFEDRVFAGLEKKRPRKKMLRVLSLICTYLIFLAVLSLFLGTVIPQIKDSIITLKDKMNSYLSTATDWIFNELTHNPILNSEFFTEIFDIQPEQLNEYINRGITWIYDNFEMLFSWITASASSFALEIKNVLLGIIFSVYFMLFKENLFAQVRKFFSSLLPENLYQKASHYQQLTDHTFGGFISGKLLDSLIIGILCFLLMSIFSMPFAPLVSMIIGVTNVIPFFGPFIGAIPSAFIIFIADPSLTLWFILLVFALQQLDGNVIGPKILGDFIGLSPLWIIVSITVMGGLFGVFGMFLGVPTFAVFYSIVKELTEKKLEKKGMSVETDDYYVDPAYLDILKSEKKPSPLSSLLKKCRKKGKKEECPAADPPAEPAESDEKTEEPK